jgi:3',5'-cyclic AMP phosphodiesterase CpdA
MESKQYKDTRGSIVVKKMSNKIEKNSRYLAIFSLIIVLAVAFAPAFSQPNLPGILSLAQQNPATNIGLGKPAIVQPGGTVQVKLQQNVQVGTVSTVYMYTVVYDSGLKIRNYTVTVTGSGNTLTLSIPPSVEPGLYDLVVKGSTTLRLPRSVWVYKTLPSKLKIVHFSDQHYGAGQPDVITGDMNRLAGYLVASLLGPDIIIDTGDIADTASADQYAQAVSFEYAFLYSYPILAVPGNHDHPPDSFTKYYGDTTWYRVIGGKLLIIGLFSPEQGYPPMEQLQWASQVLEANKDVPIKIILVHHPVFYYQGELKTRYDDQNVIAPYDPKKNPNSPVSSYWSANMDAVRYFLKMIEDYKVNYVLSGHVHRDLFTKYTSTRTGSTTYFITITTLGMGSAIYDGLDFYTLDLTTGNLDFPFKPPTFIGFNNDSRKLAQNTIPVGIYPPRNNLGVSNQVFTPTYYLQAGEAYVFSVENDLSYLDLENTVVWCLPWTGDFNIKVLNALNGASIQVLDKMYLDGKLYIALHVKLPYKGRLEFALYKAPDNQPPTIKVKMLNPAQPASGATVNVFVEVADSGWGVKNFTASYVLAGKEYKLTPELYSPNTLTSPVTSFIYKLTIPPIENVDSITIKMVAFDNAGNQATSEYKLAYQTPTPSTQQPTQPGQPSQPSQPQPNQTAPTQPTTQPSQTQPAQPPTLPILPIAGGILIVAVAMLVLLALRERKKNP